MFLTSLPLLPTPTWSCFPGAICIHISTAGGHRRRCTDPYPRWNSARSGITPTLPAAQHGTENRDYSPLVLPKHLHRADVGMETQSDGTQTVSLLGFFVVWVWVFFLLFLCFKSIWTKFFVICSCRNHTGFVEPRQQGRSKSLRDARMHPKGAPHGVASTWTGSNPSGCSSIP